MSKTQKIKAIVSAALALFGAIVALTPGTKDDRFFAMVERAYGLLAPFIPVDDSADEESDDSPEATVVIDA